MIVTKTRSQKSEVGGPSVNGVQSPATDSPAAELSIVNCPLSIVLEVPLAPAAEIPAVAWGLHVDTRLTPSQSHALRRILHELDRRQARLATGKRVVNPTDALKWLLELVGKGVPE